MKVNKVEEPVVFVVYLFKENFKPEIIENISRSIELTFEKKEFNAISFFMPTETEERMECLNPRIVDSTEYNKVKDMLSDCQKVLGIK